MKMVQRLMTLCAVLLLVCGVSFAADPAKKAAEPETFELKGTYATIDLSSQQATMNALASGPGKARDTAMAAIRKNPGSYTPPILMAFGNVIAETGKLEEGVIWVMAGHLRTRYDAERSNDETTRNVTSYLISIFGNPVKKFIEQNKEVDKLNALAKRVIEWDKVTPSKYEHRWIDLSGEKAKNVAMGKAKEGEISKPKKDWPKLLEKSRDAFAGDYIVLVQTVKEQRSGKSLDKTKSGEKMPAHGK